RELERPLVHLPGERYLPRIILFPDYLTLHVVERQVRASGLVDHDDLALMNSCVELAESAAMGLGVLARCGAGGGDQVGNLKRTVAAAEYAQVSPCDIQRAG